MPSLHTLLLLVSVSYWYCLPVITQRVVGYSEFRAYDILLLLTIATICTHHRKRISAFFRQDSPGRMLHKFCVWASVMYPVTVVWCLINGNVQWILVTSIYLFHLWGFALVYAGIRVFMTTRASCLRLLDAFLAVGFVEAVLICLQGVGVVPLLWSELYAVYGDKAFSGTLGPNRVLPGTAMVLLICVAVEYFRNAHAVGRARLVLALVASFAGILALGTTGSRTAWSTMAAYAVATLLLRRMNGGVLVMVAAMFVLFQVAAPPDLTDRITEMYEWKVSSKLERVEGEDAVTQFQAVDSGRMVKWLESIDVIANNPWIIPAGAGFNNRDFNDGNSPHNMYLTLILELGVVGLYFYVAWLVKTCIKARQNAAIADRLRRRDRTVLVSSEVTPIVVAMMVNMTAGEMIYIYRPTFAFMGMFLVVLAVLTNPALMSTTVGAAKAPVHRRAAHRVAAYAH